MGRVLWLADTLRAAGLEVIELDGWQDRGEDRLTVLGVVAHHTAMGPDVSDSRQAQVLRDGRPATVSDRGLPGPLSQLGLDRQGRYWVVASGRCNHNGGGPPPARPPLWGNDSIGIEAFNDGIGEPWPDAQLDAYEKGTAAIVAHLELDISKVKAHRETDPGRKVDPRGIDMDFFRARVAHFLFTPGDDMTPDEARAVFREVLNEGMTAGTLSWAETNINIAKGVQAVFNGVGALLARDPAEVDVDALAVMLREGLGDEIASELAERLAG